MPPATDERRIPAELWRLAAVIVFGAFMAQLDTALVNVGLNTIAHRLHGTLAGAQWVTSGYLLALAASLPTCGWLSRRIGAGRLWLAALVAFTLLSLTCALAPDLNVLIGLRVLQGAAGGLLVPTGMTVLGQAAGPSRMGRIMNTAGVAVVLAPALGPTIGGLLIENLSWHWLFLVNLPIGVVAFVLGRRILPRGDTAPAGPLDRLGLVLLTAALPLVTYGITEATRAHSLTATAVLATLPLGVVCLVAYVTRTLRRPGERPIVDLRPFGDRIYGIAQIAVVFTGAGLYGGLIILPLYFELLRGQSVVQTGLLLLAYGTGAACALPISGRLTDRVGGGVTATIGLTVTIATTLPFVFLGAHAGLGLVEALQFLRGVGLGFSGVPVISVAYASVPREQIPDATVTTNVAQRISGSLGTALFVVVLQAHGSSGIADFHRVFAWLTVTAAGALVAVLGLAVAERRAVYDRAHGHQPPAPARAAVPAARRSGA